MMGRTHAASGAAVWLVGCAAASGLGVDVDVLPAAAGAVACAVGALVPDIDHPRSLISRSLGPITAGIAHLVADLAAAVHAGTATRRDKPCRNGHRAVTHTLLFAILAGAVASAVLAVVAPAWWWLGIPLAAGCLTHDLGDACTPSGCPILWPVRIAGRRWHPIGPPWRLTLDGPGERWIVGPACTLGAIASAWALIL